MPPTPDRAAPVAGAVAAGLLGALSAFQLALALGAPWGEAAWGGRHAELPTGLRAASAVSAVVWSGAAAVALRQGGRDTWAPVPDRWLRRTTAGLALYSGVGVVMNLASRSELERAVWVPVTLAMAVSLGLTSAGGRRPAALG